MEELRQDLPNIKQRYDPEAAMMQEAADPLTVLEALKETLEGEIDNIEDRAAADEDAIAPPTLPFRRSCPHAIRIEAFADSPRAIPGQCRGAHGGLAVHRADAPRSTAGATARSMAGPNPLVAHPYLLQPLLRATETLAAIIQGFETAYRSEASRRPDVATDSLPQPQVWDDLKENNQGIFNGLTWPEAQARYPDLCDRLEGSLDWVPIPGAETLTAGRDRARRVVDQLLRHRNGDRLWIISHQWILQQIMAQILGCDRVWGMPIGHTARFEVWLDRDRWASADQRLNSELWQIKAFNDCGHLAPPS